MESMLKYTHFYPFSNFMLYAPRREVKPEKQCIGFNCNPLLKLIITFQRKCFNCKYSNQSILVKVWKEAKKMGCGQAVSKGKKGGTYTV